MGVKKFANVFPPHKEIKIREYKDKTIAIDAMTMIYRSMHAPATKKTMVNSRGEPTAHLRICLNNILKYHRCNIKQIWCFDADIRKSGPNHLKKAELKERRERRMKAANDLKVAKYRLSEIEEQLDVATEEQNEQLIQKLYEEQRDLRKKCHQLEKRTFSLKGKAIDQLKTMLNFLGVSWLESPPGYEGECVAAAMTRKSPPIADAVVSTDADVPLFGAKYFLKITNGKHNMWGLYNVDQLLRENDITQDELIKIGIILGCDFYKYKPTPSQPKSPFNGIGVMTVIQRVKDTRPGNIEGLVGKRLDKAKSLLRAFDLPDVKKAIDHYQCNAPIPEINNDYDEYMPGAKIALSDKAQNMKLIDWLVNEHGFTRRILLKNFRGLI